MSTKAKKVKEEERFDFWTELEIQRGSKDSIGNFKLINQELKGLIGDLTLLKNIYSFLYVRAIFSDENDNALMSLAVDKIQPLPNILIDIYKSIDKFDKFLSESQEKESLARSKEMAQELSVRPCNDCNEIAPVCHTYRKDI